MKEKIAQHLQTLPRSGIRDFFELVLGREDVISLGVGEPDFSAPWHIREAMIQSLEKGYTSYTSNLGLLSLRKEIGMYLERQFNLTYHTDKEIIVTVGVSEGLDLAMRAIIDPGDEVIYHEPSYVSYSPSIRMAHGVPVSVKTKGEDGFILKAEELEKKITPKSKALLLNFPTNPTGAVMPPEELEKISALCIKHDLLCITDEVYSELSYGEERHLSIASLPKMQECTIFLHGFSKAFAMTGMRLGYACAPAHLIEAMMKIHQYSMLCAPINAQYAAIEALKNGASEVAQMRDSYLRRRDYMLKSFRDMGFSCHTPGGAFYLFPDIHKTGMTSKEFALRLLEAESIATVPGDAFGSSGEGYIRCCYATDFDKIKEAMSRMKRFVASL